jgi:subtilisin family serine protease
VLVKLRPGVSAVAVRRALAGAGARRERRLGDLHVVVVRVPKRTAKALVARLRRTRVVRYAEQNRVVLRITGMNAVQAVPTDPLWGQQWGPAQIDAPVAWAVTKGAPSIVVATEDTGVDFGQPDLAGALVPGYDFVNNDADPADDQGHGTAVAGVIAARADNGLGGSGLCPRCSIMPVKVAAADGTATELNVANGITWAADHGARVINISLGGTYGATVADAVRYATAKGALVVAAAGNNGSASPFYPAAYPGALSVAGTQQDGTLYPWSNYGGWVAVAAPGCEQTTGLGAAYWTFCGTSASTPVVSGLAALAMSFAPTATADAIRQAITSSAQRLSGVAYGRVDAAGTLAALGAKFQPAPPPPVASSPPAAAPPPQASTQLTLSGAAKAAVPKQQRHRSRTSRRKTMRLLRWIPLERFVRSH